jgi:monoamine oxidase
MDTDAAATILVIGGGLAGLAAAERLARAGVPIRLVEARDRLGGRLWTERRFGARVDLGAEFLHGAPEAVARRFVAGDAGTNPPEGDAGPDEPEEDAFDADLRAFVAAAADAEEQTVASFAATLARAPRWRDRIPAILGYIGSFHAADVARMSLRGLVEIEHAQSVAEHPVRHIADGERTVRSFAEALDPARIHLGSPVATVRWAPGGVEAGLRDGRTFAGRAAIVAIPVGVLGSVGFDPEVPRVRAAAARIGIGGAVRLSLVFSAPLWEGEAFFPLEGAFSVAWTTPGAPVVVAWIGGPRAERLRGLTGERLAELALDALSDVLAPRAELAARLVGWAHHDWLDDPYAKGAYSWPVAGALDAPGELAKPEADMLFFAGEATCPPAEAGTVHGAVLSGWRAADEVLRAIVAS